ncbi:sensor histidine kinase [Allosediminivita pacifica]|uniref:histidine kinase n=1 Tax=Allosediminivita pacifica TaxID=1267769 RepID=A0A2T6ARJ0_9RHOB|nr:ATP-binding protein [Allosediminivita pacifica]PTX46431.1 signal transduction histidine kinase [Allosediminivita pacifica]GGB17246.1 hypothetical protein GCM10011324_29350 [Allosediminivita pacifica]
MPQSKFGRRLGAVRRAEFGSPMETAARSIGILATSAALYLASHDPIFPIWCASYFLFEGLFLLIAGWPPKRNIRAHFGLAILFYNLSALNFAWLPLYMIWLGEPGYALVGGLGIFGMLLYTLHRTEYEASLVISDCLHAVVVAGALLVIIEPRIDSTAMQVAGFICALAVAKYFCLGMWAKLRNQAQHRRTEQRYAAAQKERALSQFVGGVAHDFNNQLTAILGNLELIDHLHDPSDRAHAMRAVHEAGGNAAQTVRQLLATTGRAPLRPRWIDLNHFVDTRISYIRDLMGDAIRLDVGPIPEHARVTADPGMLETALVELCQNARDAMEEGTGRIRISATDESPGGRQAPRFALVVEDDGPGVDDSALAMLTEPFYTTKGVGEGPGLGLSAVRGFAHQSGGELRIGRSAMGGLRIALVLPEVMAQLPASGAS